MSDTEYNSFLDAMVAFAVTKHINEHEARLIMKPYLKDIDVHSEIVQNIGPEYYATKILMKEHKIGCILI